MNPFVIRYNDIVKEQESRVNSLRSQRETMRRNGITDLDYITRKLMINIQLLSLLRKHIHNTQIDLFEENAKLNQKKCHFQETKT